MKNSQGQVIRLEDYQPPAFKISHVFLDIRLDPEETVVISTLQVARNGDHQQPLVLDGEDLKLDFVAINGDDLRPNGFETAANSLIIPNVPDAPFELEITTRVNPTTNTQLMGLYRTNDVYCTQCEAEGFRRITYFLDRPDVLATYKTRLEGSQRDLDVLLSNGNLIETGTIKGTDRKFAVWEDPHPKPSYLFALVAGKLAHISDTFTTMSGREVALEIYVEPGKEGLCDWAMESLKRCMKWDEDVFGREYDLDIFMIVAVSDFNMGAMENKGLNVFNDKYVLADVTSATDQDFVNIEAIIAHEYFHNWTGNRITCRDWFQLCLKEGFTVFRDQEFTADMRSRPVKRISDVRMLRARQFPEDNGPLAHPVRPATYHEINNFYTATVYEKGAELVRMVKIILGEEAFAKGIDLYFQRHDGEAATIEDFIKSLEDGSGQDLSHFARWYGQAGTPQVLVEPTYDPSAKTYTLATAQKTAATPNEPSKIPMHIPVRFGFLDKNGEDMCFESVTGARVEGDVIHLEDAHHTITFSGVGEEPVPSLLRGFSAPVTLDIPLSEEALIHLIGNDTDTFNRWQAMQTIAMRVVLANLDGSSAAAASNAAFFDAIGNTISDESLDPAFRSQFLSLPSQTDLAQRIGKNVDPSNIFEAIHKTKKDLAKHLRDSLIVIYEKNQIHVPYAPSAEQVGARTLKNSALALLVHSDANEERIAREQYKTADNLTDRLAALTTLVHCGSCYAPEALSDFDKRYRLNPLVMDKWFAVQAMSPLEDTLTSIKQLMKHPAFSITNPNRLRALIGSFAAGNQVQFNRADGAGYQFVSTIVADLDPINPQVAARLLTSFNSWRMLEPNRRDRAELALKRIANTAGLSTDVRDIVNRTLDR